jgi:hypothetical protein
MSLGSLHRWDLLRRIDHFSGVREVQRAFLARDRDRSAEVALVLYDKSFPANRYVIDHVRSGIERYKTIEAGTGLLTEVETHDTETHFIVCNEYIPGADTIGGLLATGHAFTEREIVQVGIQVSDALARAHARSVVFGKLVVLHDPATGRAAICSVPIDVPTGGSLLQSAYFLGEPGFHAPEVLLDSRTSPQSDVYYLCMILHLLCVGPAPYGARNAGGASFAVVNQPAPVLPASAGVSDGLASVIAGGLCKDVALRIPSAALLGERLASLRPSSRPVLTDERASELARRYYPYPIARHVDLVEHVDDEAFRMTQLSGALEAIVTLVGALAVAEARRAGLPTTDAEAQLRRPSLGQWVGVARDLARKLADRPAGDLICPELPRSFLTGTGKVADAARLLDAMVAWRNRRFGHARPGDLADVVGAAAEGRRMLWELLRELSFLAQYQLLIAESLEYKEERFLVRAVRFTGQAPERATVASAGPIPTGEVLFSDRSLERRLSLGAFMRYADCPECGVRDLFLYQSERGSGATFAGVHRAHYLEAAL